MDIVYFGEKELSEEEHCPEKELADQWRSENREKGRRLEDITERVLERMKKEGIIKEFKRLENEAKPDFIVDEEIGIEDKNRDPMKKNTFNKHTIKTQITSKFEGRKWRKKVLLITKLEIYPRDEEECRRLLQDYVIIELGSFVTEENKDEMEEKLFHELIEGNRKSCLDKTHGF